MKITHSSLVGDIVTLYYNGYITTHVNSFEYIKRNYINVDSIDHIDTHTFKEPNYSGISRYKVTFKPEGKNVLS